jgi:hypothetical protein
MHIITGHVLSGFLISPNGFISSVKSPNLIFFWIIREVLLMSKIKMFPLPTISRVSNLSIRLVIHMSKQYLNIPWVGEHTLQAVDHR